MAHGTGSPRGILPSPSHASLDEGIKYEGPHTHPKAALQRLASAHTASRRVNSADLSSQGSSRDAPHPVRSAPRLTRSATARPTSNTVPRRAAPAPPLSPPRPPAGVKSSSPPSKQHWMAHGLEKEATPRASASTKHGSHKRGGTGAAADVLLEQLEVTGFDNASSRRLIRTFVQGQQATYKRQLEAIYMDKQANAYKLSLLPPARPPFRPHPRHRHRHTTPTPQPPSLYPPPLAPLRWSAAATTALGLSTCAQTSSTRLEASEPRRTARHPSTSRPRPRAGARARAASRRGGRRLRLHPVQMAQRRRPTASTATPPCAMPRGCASRA